MRKKWIVIIVICVLLLAVAGLTFSRGLEMKPELAAVGNMGGAAPAGESGGEEPAGEPEPVGEAENETDEPAEPPKEAGDNAVEESSDDHNTEPPAAQPDTNSASAEPFAESGVIGEGLIGDGYY